MSKFADTLFARRPFVRWTAVPVLAMGVLVFIFLAANPPGESKTIGTIVYAGIAVACAAMAVALAAPKLFWLMRVVTGLVFLAYLSYLVSEFFFNGGAAEADPEAGKNEANPVNALLGFLVPGVQFLRYPITVRFTVEPSMRINAQMISA